MSHPEPKKCSRTTHEFHEIWIDFQNVTDAEDLHGQNMEVLTDPQTDLDDPLVFYFLLHESTRYAIIYGKFEKAIESSKRAVKLLMDHMNCETFSIGHLTHTLNCSAAVDFKMGLFEKSSLILLDALSVLQKRVDQQIQDRALSVPEGQMVPGAEQPVPVARDFAFAFAMLRRNLAEVQLKLGQVGRAEEALRKAVEDLAKDQGVKTRCKSIYLATLRRLCLLVAEQTGREGDATDLYLHCIREAQALYPKPTKNSLYVKFQLVGLLFKQGRLQETHDVAVDLFNFVRRLTLAEFVPMRASLLETINTVREKLNLTAFDPAVEGTTLAFGGMSL